MSSGRGKWKQYYPAVGAPYDSRKWRALRKRVMQRDGHLCVLCWPMANRPDNFDPCKHKLSPATDVDHIVPKARFARGAVSGDPDALDNLRALCQPCHDLVTENRTTGKPTRKQIQDFCRAQFYGFKGTLKDFIGLDSGGRQRYEDET